MVRTINLKLSVFLTILLVQTSAWSRESCERYSDNPTSGARCSIFVKELSYMQLLALGLTVSNANDRGAVAHGESLREACIKATNALQSMAPIDVRIGTPRFVCTDNSSRKVMAQVKFRADSLFIERTAEEFKSNIESTFSNAEVQMFTRKNACRVNGQISDLDTARFGLFEGKKHRPCSLRLREFVLNPGDILDVVLTSGQLEEAKNLYRLNQVSIYEFPDEANQ